MKTINRVLRRFGVLLVPCPPSAKMLREHANVSEVHHPSRGGNTVRWMRRVAAFIETGAEAVPSPDAAGPASQQGEYLVSALRRLAVADEMAGMGDVTDPEGAARITYARQVLREVGLSHKTKETENA